MLGYTSSKLSSPYFLKIIDRLNTDSLRMISFLKFTVQGYFPGGRKEGMFPRLAECGRLPGEQWCPQSKDGFAQRELRDKTMFYKAKAINGAGIRMFC